MAKLCLLLSFFVLTLGKSLLSNFIGRPLNEGKLRFGVDKWHLPISQLNIPSFFFVFFSIIASSGIRSPDPWRRPLADEYAH